jgi:hypothetical protein
MTEPAAASAASTSVSAAGAHAAGVADPELPESSSDPDRVEDQVGDQTAPDTVAR